MGIYAKDSKSIKNVYSKKIYPPITNFKKIFKEFLSLKNIFMNQKSFENFLLSLKVKPFVIFDR